MFDLKEILETKIREYYLFRKMAENDVKMFVQNNNYAEIEACAKSWRECLEMEGKLSKVLNKMSYDQEWLKTSLEEYRTGKEHKEFYEILQDLEEKYKSNYEENKLIKDKGRVIKFFEYSEYLEDWKEVSLEDFVICDNYMEINEEKLGVEDFVRRVINKEIIF